MVGIERYLQWGDHGQSHGNDHYHLHDYGRYVLYSLSQTHLNNNDIDSNWSYKAFAK